MNFALPPQHKAIVRLEDKWWPQTMGQGGDKTREGFMCSVWKKHSERPHVGGVFIRSSNGAPFRKRYIIHAQTTKEVTNEDVPDPSHPPHCRRKFSRSLTSRSTVRVRDCLFTEVIVVSRKTSCTTIWWPIKRAFHYLLATATPTPVLRFLGADGVGKCSWVEYLSIFCIPS